MPMILKQAPAMVMTVGLLNTQPTMEPPGTMQKHYLHKMVTTHRYTMKTH